MAHRSTPNEWRERPSTLLTSLGFTAPSPIKATKGPANGHSHEITPPSGVSLVLQDLKNRCASASAHENPYGLAAAIPGGGIAAGRSVSLPPPGETGLHSYALSGWQRNSRQRQRARPIFVPFDETCEV